MSEPEQIKCPCCGQVAVVTGQVRVNLDTNTLYFRCRKVVLTPQLAELAHILTLRMPGPVAHYSIVAQLWGNDEPDDALATVRVLICKLRSKLLSVSLGVSNYQERGYALVALPVLARSFSTPRTEDQHAHA